MMASADEINGGEVDDKTVTSPADPPTRQEESFHEDFIKDLSSFEEGKIVEGSVVAITEDSVFVDIGYKSEGEIKKSEFPSPPEPGEKIHVMIMRMESRDGKLILSKQRADTHLKWEAIRKAYNDNLPVEGRVTGSVKGGFKVSLEEAVEAFLPSSQTGLRRGDDQDSILGMTFAFLIDKMERKNNIVVSHRKYLKELHEKQAAEFFSTKNEGDVIAGVVKDIVSYGAFIDLGGLDGLLHTNDLSWGRVNDPKKYLKKGEEITCKVLKMDAESRKVSLGLKQLVPDPWMTFESRYERGGVYEGTVTKLTNFGAFVELEPGIEGLLHVSELSWTRRINHPKEVLKVGEMQSVMILDYNLGEKTVSLGLKQVLPNPWDDMDVRYPVGSKIKGKITSIAKFGLFVEVEEGVEGLVHIDDISWTKQGKNPTDGFKKGDTAEAMVISIDKEGRKIKLGMKQLQENPWKSLKERHPRGSVVSGKVTSIVDFGVFVQVDEDIEGLIHISQIANERVENPSSLFKIGDEIKAMVLDIDENKKKVTLSIRDYQNRLEAKELNKYIQDGSENTDSMPLGDLIDLSKIGK